MYKEEQLFLNESDINRSWSIDGSNYSQHHIGTQYYVDGTIVSFNLTIRSSPYAVPLYGFAVVYSEYSHFQHFLSTGDIIMEHVFSKYRLQANLSEFFNVYGHYEPQYKFVGVKFFVQSQLQVQVAEHMIKYSTTDLQPTTCASQPMSEGCVVSLDSHSLHIHLLVKLEDMDNSEGLTVSSEVSGSVDDAGEVIVGLEYSTRPAEETHDSNRDLHWRTVWLTLSLAILCLITTLGIALALKRHLKLKYVAS